MKIIGLTGAIASGKSTVAKLLRNKGAIVIDADVIARDVMETNSSVMSEIVEHFGTGMLASDGGIDRSKLANKVFKDEKELMALNAIVHPAVINEITRRLELIEGEHGDGKIVVLDIPLLIEVGWHEKCDVTITVRADYELRLQRLIEKGMPVEDALLRIQAQKEKEQLESQAQILIDNNATFEELEKKIDDVWNNAKQYLRH